jgi:hypothetical protein
MSLALTSIALGIIWDISWHETIGRDTFWTPAHGAIYLGGTLAGLVGGWLALRHTFFPRPGDTDAAVRVFGARAPLGAWIAIWGALAMITSGPFDNWWHNAYGLDVRIISPPHAVLGLGMFGMSVGALLLVLARQNRFDEACIKGSGLFVYAGGVFVLLGSVFILEYTFPNEQHGARFYKVCALMYPARLVALSCAARISWPATRVALVYMAGLCIIDWILTLFPAQPRLAPIFNPVTHMVPLPFPLLLVFPAAGIDLLLRNKGQITGKWRTLLLVLALGAVFLAILLAVQWFFSKFMISPRSNNWFFMGNRVWGYNVSAGEWQHRYWHVDASDAEFDPFTLRAFWTSLLLSIGGAGIGLFFGRWMRKVRR